jgi:hypothetical protein
MTLRSVPIDSIFLRSSYSPKCEKKNSANFVCSEFSEVGIAQLRDAT